MKPKIVLYSKIHEEVIRKLEEKCDVIFLDMYDPDFEDEFADHLPQVKGIIGDGLTIDQSVIERASNLKVISNISVGYDNLDMDAIRKRKIIATNTPDILTETTADLMFTLLLSTARKVPQLDRYVKEGKWNGPLSSDLIGHDVHGKY